MSACRLNLSDRRIRRLVDFGEKLPVPRPLQYRDTVDALPKRKEHLCLRQCQVGHGGCPGEWWVVSGSHAGMVGVVTL